ncbi:hypothetical protein HMPREF9550_03775 [Escherichia coli MS 187-1]|nr:hypothetical protein HMPREF9550_03775 [Escherichia coli MS 187-1]
MQSRKNYFIFLKRYKNHLNEVYNIYRQPVLILDYFLSAQPQLTPLQLTNLHQSTINLHTLLCDNCQPLNMRFVIYV